LKLVFDRNTGRILGVHLFGENSSELVNYGAELVNDGLTVFQVLHFVFPAVTYHQLYHQASMEAKLRFKGARDLAGAAAWWSLKNQLARSLHQAGAQASVEETLLAALRRTDDDNSGFVTQAELREAVLSLGLKTSEEAIGAMILEAAVDVKQDQIDYQHIMRMIQQGEDRVQRQKSKMQRSMPKNAMAGICAA